MLGQEAKLGEKGGGDFASKKNSCQTKRLVFRVNNHAFERHKHKQQQFENKLVTVTFMCTIFLCVFCVVLLFVFCVYAHVFAKLKHSTRMHVVVGCKCPICFFVVIFRGRGRG